MERPRLTQREAAERCGVGRTTIRRRREEGAFPGAVQDPKRGWLIPVEDLLAAGLRVDAPSAPEASPPTGADLGGEGVEELRAQLREEQLARVEDRVARAVAEAQVGELRQRLDERSEHIRDLQNTIRALEAAPERPALPAPTTPPSPAADAAPVPQQSHAPAAPASETPPPKAKSRWWRR